MLTGHGYEPGEPMPALVGIAVCVAAVGVLGVAVGAALRHSAAAITAVLGVLIVPELFGPLFADAQRWITGAAPSAAVVKLSQSSDATAEAMGGVGGWPSLVLLCSYSVLAWVGAAGLLHRRDA
jgi:ABC-2 type transport system permease protein